jgi:hypothetical protein
MVDEAKTQSRGIFWEQSWLSKLEPVYKGTLSCALIAYQHFWGV